MRARACVVTALVALGTMAAQGQTPLIPAAQRVMAPDFTVKDVQGKTVKLSEYRGKVVLLDFWAVTCGGCQFEIPWFVAFGHRYSKEGLRLIGLDMYGEKPEMIRPFMKQQGMDYPVAVGNDALGRQFGLKAMPLTLLIDRQGRIAARHAGIVDPGAWEKDIQQLLQ